MPKFSILLGAAAAVFSLGIAPARVISGALAQQTVSQPAVRDGAHDFDFLPGTWHTQIKRVRDPLSGGTHIVDMSGTVTERPGWGGAAWIEEIEAGGPSGHFQGMTVFLYNPTAGQWSQTFVGRGDSAFDAPSIGSFQNGVGEFYATETFEGRQVLVRGTWSDITPDAHNYTISYSADGGRSWHPTFSAHLTRISH